MDEEQRSDHTWSDPDITESLLLEMEEKEAQLALAAEFGKTLLDRTEELQLDNEAMEREKEAAMQAAEEHAYRAQELKQALDRLAEEAAEKDFALEVARAALETKQNEMDAKMAALEGTQAESEALTATAQQSMQAARDDAAREIARLEAQSAEISRRETETREAKDAEEQERLSAQKKQREAEERLAKQLEKQKRLARKVMTELSAEREQKAAVEADLAKEKQERETSERKHAQILASEREDLLMRSTADFKALRDAAAPGQFDSPEPPGGAAGFRSSLEEAVLRDEVASAAVLRTVSHERHQQAEEALRHRTSELERKLREAGLSPNSSPDPRGDIKPPASPDGDGDGDDGLRSSEEVQLFESAPEPEPEQQQPTPHPARDCLRLGKEQLMRQDTEAAVKQFERGLALLERPPPRNGAFTNEMKSADDAAVNAELTEQRDLAKQLLERKEVEFRVKFLLEKGRECLKEGRAMDALAALQEGLEKCSEAGSGALRVEFEDEHRKAEIAAGQQTERQRVQQQDVTEARKSGWLHKKGDTFKNFKRRWFELDFASSSSTAGSGGGGPAHPRIEYFESEGGPLKGTIELTGDGLSYDCVRAFENDLLQFQLTTPERAYVLLAPTFYERERWVAAIRWALDPAKAREVYGDGSKYHQIREEEERMYVVASVTTTSTPPLDDPDGPRPASVTGSGKDSAGGVKAPSTYYKIRVRHQRKVFDVTKRYSDFDRLHTHLHAVSEPYRQVLTGTVLSHGAGVTLKFMGVAGQGGGLEFPKKTWFDSSGSDVDVVAERKEKLGVWLQRIVMIDGLKEDQQLLEFIGAAPSRNTMVTPRDDLDTDGYYK